MRRVLLYVAVVGVLACAQPASAQALTDAKTMTAASSSCTSSNCVEVAARGIPSIGIGVAGSGTYTLVVEGTRDGGSTWRTINIVDDSDQSAVATSITTAGSYSFQNSGYTSIRVRTSVLSSGTPVVTLIRGVSVPLFTGSGGGGGAGVSDVDDSSFAVGSDDLVPAGALFDDTTPDSVDEGDVGVPRMSANRNLYTTIRDAAGNERGANVNASGQLSVEVGNASVTVSATNLDVQSGGADLATEATLGGVLTSANFAAAFGTAGTADSQVLSVQGISGGTAIPVSDNGSTLTVDGTVTVTDGAGALNVIVDSGSVTVSATNLDVQSGGADLATEATAAGILTSANFAAAFGTAGAADSQVLSVQGITGGTALPVSDNGGTLSIDDGGGAITVDGSISCSNCSGSGASDVDDSSFTIGTDSVAPAGFLFDDVTPDSVDEGDTGLARMSANRVQYGIIRDGASGAERGASVTANNELLVELGAGTASIGVLGANSGVDIGDVTLNNASIAVTQSGTWDEVGINDSGNSITVDGTVTVTDGAGALNVICDSGCGSGTQYAEDAAHVSGDQTMFVSGIRRDTTPSSSATTAGDYSAFNIDGNGRLYVQAVLYNSSGTELSIASDGTVGSAIGTTAPMGTAVYADFDGAAIPTITNVDTEGELVPIAASVKGVQYMMLVSEDGSLQYGTSTTPLVVGDGSGALNVIIDSSATLTVTATNLDIQSGGADLATSAQGAAIQTATELLDNVVGVEDAAETAGGGLAMAGAVVRSTASGSSATAGDNATLNVDTLGRLWTRNGNPCADHARISSVAINTSTSGNVELVALNGSDLIYVCGYSVVAGAATGVQFIYGTGTACATGETDITGVWSFAANGGITQANGGVPQFVVPAGNAFCVENSGANSIQGHVTYVRTANP